jgi:hypothetical protein
MIRSTRNITLVLASCGLAALGFGLWDHAGNYPTTRSSTGTYGYHGSSWYSRAFGSSGSHSSYSSGTSRGGFGSTGHAVSS